MNPIQLRAKSGGAFHETVQYCNLLCSLSILFMYTYKPQEKENKDNVWQEVTSFHERKSNKQER